MLRYTKKYAKLKEMTKENNNNEINKRKKLSN